MNIRWQHIALLFALLIGLTGAPVHAQEEAPGYTVPMTGEVPSFVGETEYFVGTMSIGGFDRQGSTLVVKGFLAIDPVDGGRSTIGNIRRDIVQSVAYVEGGCDGVNVVLEPLAVGEAGQEIFLSAITLENRAQAGANTKLDKLLCAVGNLVEHNAPSGGLASLLNQILRALS
jgi:hypothetical protein